MAGSHSLFSPSSSHRWSTCTASLLHIAAANTPNESGMEAMEGTAAHLIADMCLTQGCYAETFKGSFVTIYKNTDGVETAAFNEFEPLFMSDGEEHLADFRVDDEMVDAVNIHVLWALSTGGIQFPEMRVRIPGMPVETYGTSDFCAIVPIASETKTKKRRVRLIVQDLKYGTGVLVFADKNTQLLMYAIGVYFQFCREYDIVEIELRICQPRRGIKDVWEISKDELLDWHDFLTQKAAEAYDAEIAEFKPGEKQCTFCPLDGNCKAQMDMIFKECTDLFDFTDDDEDAVPTVKYEAGLTNEELAQILKYKSLIKSFLEKASAEAMRRALDGEEIPDYKLAYSRPKNQLNHAAEKDIIEFLGANIPGFRKASAFHKPKLKGMTELTKGLGKAVVTAFKDQFMIKPDPTPTLVPADDKRPAIDPESINSDSTDIFNTIDEE